MLHILPQERLATANSAGDDKMVSDSIGMDAPSIEDLRRNQALDETEEYEFVLGQRQIASLSFVLLVVIALIAGIAYLAGRGNVAHAAPPSDPTIEAAAGHPTPPPPAPAPVVQPQPAIVNADLFAEPITGAIYIQAAATDRGVATIMVEGIRTHNLPAIVAPGPSENIFRVLVGPFPNMPAYQRAKDTLDQIGVNAFARFQK